MLIEYTIDSADFSAYASYAIRHEPPFRKTARQVQSNSAVIFALSAVTLSALAHNILPALPMAAIGVGVTWNERYAYCKRLQKRWTDASRLCLNHPHLLEATPQGLHIQCPITDAHIRWIGVRGVAETQNHVFVQLGHDGGACIIARERVIKGDLNALVADIRGFVSGRGA